MRSKIAKTVGLMIILSLILTVGGCTRSTGRMEVRRLGFSTKLPLGWKQGRYVRGKEKNYVVKSGGAYCFESVGKRYPYGCVLALPLLSASSSLSDYVKKLVVGELISETYGTVSDLEAVEIVEEDVDPDDGRPIKVFHVYIRKSNQIIWVSFWSLSKDFDRYELHFRQAIDSIRIK